MPAKALPFQSEMFPESISLNELALVFKIVFPKAILMINYVGNMRDLGSIILLGTMTLVFLIVVTHAFFKDKG